MIRKINGYSLKWGAKVVFFVTGIASLTWFLVRVIPKPSRAAYPCMRAALPMASSLLVYLIGLTSFTMLMRKAKDRFRKAKYTVSAVLALAGLLVGGVSLISYNIKLNANPLTQFAMPNEVYGEGVGIFPGRVVWEFNPDATDKNCPNVDGDYWYQHTDQRVVNAMLSAGLRNLTGTTDDEAAWDALFKHFNGSHGNGDVGYSPGETIVIKTNNNARWMGEHGINTSPQITWAILNQLVRRAGVNEHDIFIGDPNCGTPDYTYDHCSPDFPDVNYWGQNAGVVPEDDVLVLSDQTLTDPLPRSYVDASYMINIPVLKKHHRAGISIAAKNHFGSIAPFTSGAWHLHYSLPCPEASGIAVNGNYGAYRCFVDLMGHKDLGGKTILYLVDGLWGSTNWGHPPVRWSMSPFNFDWPNSLFLSQDPVAVESVCLDFLYEEFDADHPTEGGTPTEDKGPFPRFKGTDDYLRQAADPSLRPFDYDPEGDGSVLGSLGVYERWNNAIDKQYSRNLGLDRGIELFSELVASSTNVPLVRTDGQLSSAPNPFREYTTVSYHLQDPGTVRFNIYNINGQMVYTESHVISASGKQEFVWNGTDARGKPLPAGQYNLKLTAEGGVESPVLKMMIVR
jgi:hypothetical protein